MCKHIFVTNDVDNNGFPSINVQQKANYHKGHKFTFQHNEISYD